MASAHPKVLRRGIGRESHELSTEPPFEECVTTFSTQEKGNAKIWNQHGSRSGLTIGRLPPGCASRRRPERVFRPVRPVAGLLWLPRLGRSFRRLRSLQAARRQGRRSQGPRREATRPLRPARPAGTGFQEARAGTAGRPAHRRQAQRAPGTAPSLGATARSWGATRGALG
jgi:hypothetical protein